VLILGEDSCVKIRLAKILDYNNVRIQELNKNADNFEGLGELPGEYTPCVG